jgi:uncharacterized protein (UPF0276 family)
MTLLGAKWSSISDAAADQVDVVEVAGWDFDRRGESAPCLLHNLDLDFSLSLPQVLDQRWIERCNRALERTKSPWFSLHLGFSTEQVRFRDHMLPASPGLDRATCLERMTDAIGFACRHLDMPVLIENLDYCPEGAYEHVCDPDWMGIEPVDYASNLPLERVVEIHLSSPRQIGSHLDDGHFELLEQDFRLFEWVLERCEPQAVVLEYARDQHMLREQLRQIRDVLDRNRVGMGKLESDDRASRTGLTP